jgi:hypothetical protein
MNHAMEVRRGNSRELVRMLLDAMDAMDMLVELDEGAKGI